MEESWGRVDISSRPRDARLYVSTHTENELSKNEAAKILIFYKFAQTFFYVLGINHHF